MSTVREIRSLTGLRGAAALYVVAYHYTEFYCSLYQNGSSVGYSTHLRTLVSHGYLSVDLFFILSGFVMALNYQRMFERGWSWSIFGKFLGRRIARIYPLYLVATIAGWYLTAHQRFPPPATSKALVMNLLMIQVWGIKCMSFGASWSISAEFAAYLLFPLLLIPAAFRRASVSWFTAFLCVAMLCVLCFLSKSLGGETGHGSQSLLDFYDYRFGLCIARCLPEFTLGLLAYRFESTPLGRSLGSSSWVSVLLTLVIIGLLPFGGTDLIIVLLCPFLLASLASGNNLPKRLLSIPLFEKLGVYSYGIYLVHTLMMSPIRRINVLAEHKHLPYADYLGFAGGAALTLILAILGNKLIEVPGRQWLRSVFEAKQSSLRAELR